jgi:hypothetical protein
LSAAELKEQEENEAKAKIEQERIAKEGHDKAEVLKLEQEEKDRIDAANQAKAD